MPKFEYRYRYLFVFVSASDAGQLAPSLFNGPAADKKIHMAVIGKCGCKRHIVLNSINANVAKCHIFATTIRCKAFLSIFAQNDKWPAPQAE